MMQYHVLDTPNDIQIMFTYHNLGASYLQTLHLISALYLPKDRHTAEANPMFIS